MLSSLSRRRRSSATSCARPPAESTHAARRIPACPRTRIHTHAPIHRHETTSESINALFELRLDDNWTGGGEETTLTLRLMLSLLFYVAARFSFLVVGITLPLPCGVFAPSLAIGAGVGRVVGELMRYFDIGFADTVLPGGYAVLGAASMAAGVTRTISSAILVFELTGGLEHVLPILVAVTISYVLGESYSPSVFDSILLEGARHDARVQEQGDLPQDGGAGDGAPREIARRHEGGVPRAPARRPVGRRRPPPRPPCLPRVARARPRRPLGAAAADHARHHVRADRRHPRPRARRRRVPAVHRRRRHARRRPRSRRRRRLPRPPRQGVGGAARRRRISDGRRDASVRPRTPRTRRAPASAAPPPRLTPLLPPPATAGTAPSTAPRARASASTATAAAAAAAAAAARSRRRRSTDAPPPATPPAAATASTPRRCCGARGRRGRGPTASRRRGGRRRGRRRRSARRRWRARSAAGRSRCARAHPPLELRTARGRRDPRAPRLSAPPLPP